jgi:hypothetical protein
MSYNVVDVPKDLKTRNLAEFRVEFLTCSSKDLQSKKKSHVVFAVSFLKPAEDVQAVEISMDLHDAETGAGQLNVKTRSYAEESEEACRFFSFEFRPAHLLILTLGDLLNVVTELNLHDFSFIDKEGVYVGCRDFM